LGDVSIQTPDTERGVTTDPETGEVKFSYWKPVVFQNQATFSEAGLQKVLAYMQSQENPIPGICPSLVYKWHVMYTDGSVLSQFQTEGNDEVELNSKDIDFSRVSQFSVVPHYVTEDMLPTYTFVKETGKIYKAGVELDLMYGGEYHPEADLVYARKVTQTYASQMVGLDRDISNVHVTVLQLLGWKVGGLKGPGPGMIIAIDERGNWRPWEHCL
jgi:hypothetical protein